MLNKLEPSAALTGTKLSLERLCVQCRRMKGCSVVNSSSLSSTQDLQRVHHESGFISLQLSNKTASLHQKKEKRSLVAVWGGWEEGHAQG